MAWMQSKDRTATPSTAALPMAALAKATLVMAALLLGGCATASGGEDPVALSSNAREGDMVNEEAGGTVSAGEPTHIHEAEPVRTETATFALG